MKRTWALVLIASLVAVGIWGCGESDQPLVPDRVALTLASVPSGSGPEPVAVPLIAGKTIPAGTVECWIEGGTLYVRYLVGEGWSLKETHLAVAADLSGIPMTPSGNPQPGRFPMGTSHMPFVQEYTYSVDIESYGLTEAATITFAAHAALVRIDEDLQVLGEESAWAEGERFPHDPPGKPKHETGSWAMYFTLDAMQMRGLILWNKLGSAEEIQNSEYGPNGVITGDLFFLPAQHGTGFKAQPRTGDHNIPDNFVDFGNLGLGQRGCMEFWYQPDWRDYWVGHIISAFAYGPPGSDYLLVGEFNDWQGLYSFVLRDPPASGVQISFRPWQLPEWSTSQPMHVALTWDDSQPIVCQRLRVFINGLDVFTMGGWCAGATGDPKFDDQPADAVLRLASRRWSGDWDRHPWEGDHDIYDNIKIWNYAKTDFSDRFAE